MATVAVVGPDFELFAAISERTATGWDEVLSTSDDITLAEVARIESEFALLCGRGAELQPHLRSLIDQVLFDESDIDFAYFDSYQVDKPDPSRRRAQHRPGFSPERLAAQMYLGDVVLVRVDTLRAVLSAEQSLPQQNGSGLSLSMPLSVDDALRVVERCRAIAHVPRIGYRSVTDPENPVVDLRPSSGKNPAVSIVMATRGSEREVAGRLRTLVVHAADSIAARTAYENYEIIVVLTPGSPEDLPDRIMNAMTVHGRVRIPPVTFCRDNRPFNFSNACNRGASLARGEVLIFLNDDTEVQSPEWVDRLVDYAVRPDVGAVGPRLLYEDGTIQHAGIWSRGGYPSHRYLGSAADHSGHLQSLTVPQNCLAVTGACLAVETSKYTEAGGFCPEFPSSYNDVDLCLKLSELGYRTVVTPEAVLIHFESSSRHGGISDDDFALLQRRWRRLLTNDPYDNPNHRAPEADEYPPPDPAVTIRLEKAGMVDYQPRVWRLSGAGL